MTEGSIRYRCERGIKQAIAHRRGVDDKEMLEVGVDAPFQRQVHQHGARERVSQGDFRDRREIAVGLVDQQKQQFFSQPQHGGNSTEFSVSMGIDNVTLSGIENVTLSGIDSVLLRATVAEPYGLAAPGFRVRGVRLACRSIQK